MKYKIDDLVVDMTSRQVFRGEAFVALSDLSWRVLAALIAKSPEAVSSNELAAAAWREDHVSQDTVTQRIKLLRQALGDDPAKPRYIATERGVGYRLAVAPEVMVTPQKPSFATRAMMIGGGVGLVLVAILVLGMRDRNLPQPNGERASIASTITTDDLVVSGRDYLSRGSFNDNENALTMFEKALLKDSDNIDALVGLSFAYSHRATKYDFDVEASQQSEKLARRALALAPQKASAWHALGFALDAQGRVSTALRAYEQAIAIDPDETATISSAAYLLQVQGRLHEALLLGMEGMRQGSPTLFSQIQIASALRLAGFKDAANTWLARAETLTPDNILLPGLKLETLLAEGDFERAVGILSSKAGEHRAANHIMRGEALYALGRIDEARAAFSAAIEQDKNQKDGAFERAALDISRQENAILVDSHPLIANLRDSRADGDEWPGSSVKVAYLFAAAGDVEGAVGLLRDAYRYGYRDANRLRQSPFFRDMRTHPAFEAILREMENAVAVQRSLIKNDSRLAEFLTAKV